MEFNLSINQKAISDNFPTLDIKDAAIIDFLTRFSHSSGIQKKFSKVGKKTLVYHWFDYKYIASENPLLRLDSESIRRRMRNICKLGILIAHEENQGGQVFFAFGDNYEKTHKHRAENPEGSASIGQKIPKGRAENPELLSKHRADLPDNHKNHLIINTNNHEEEKANPLSSSPENQPTLEAEKKLNNLHRGAAGNDYDFAVCDECHGAGWHLGRNGREACEKCGGSRTITKPKEMPLEPPFTKIAEIEPQPATIVRLYENDLPGVTIVDSVPGTYDARRGKPPARYEPHVHPENENVFAHFTDPEKAKTIWGQWLGYKWSEHRQKYKTAESELTAIRKLWKTVNGDTGRFSNAVEHSISNLYKGIFEPKQQQNGRTDKATQNRATMAEYLIQRRIAAAERGDYGAMGEI